MGYYNIKHFSPPWLKLALVMSVFHCTLSAEQPPSSSASVGMYTAVAPKSISPYSTYNISVFVEPRSNNGTGTGTDGSTPLRFQASLHSLKENYTDSESISILPGQSGVVSLTTQDLTATRYNLTLKIKDGVNEIEKTTVIFPKKKEEAVILIHTDKPMYKPGETVQFRVILLNGEAKPFPPSSDSDSKESQNYALDIKIFDSEQNVIKVWENTQPKTGLFSAKLPLSSEPVLGDWNIEVTPKIIVPDAAAPTSPAAADAKSSVALGSNTSSKLRGFIPRRRRVVDDSGRRTHKFTVALYVLPKFEVTIKLPPFITFNETTVPVEVQAKYTYGKNVKGDCTLVPKRSYWNNNDDVVSSTFPIDGSAVREVDIKHLFKEGNLYEQDITFEAQVTETVTGKSENGTASVQMYKYPYKIEQIVRMDYLKPGLPFNIIFKVLTQDNIPIGDPSPHALKISHGFSYDKKFGSLESSIPPNGLVNLTFETPSNELIQVSRIDVTYKDLIHNYYVPQKYNADTNTYISIKLLGSNNEVNPLVEPVIRVNSKLNIIVNATQPFSSVNYLVYGGRQEIFSFAKVNLPSPVTEYKLEITCPSKAPPEATVIVYILNAEDEIIVDSLKFSAIKLEEDFDNFLNISVSNPDSAAKAGAGAGADAETFEPGQNISLKLQSTSNSLIALRGVDQSVLLLKEKDTDITQKSVDDEIKAKNDDLMNRNRIYGGSNAFQIFEQGGLTIMSNAKIQIEKAYPEIAYDLSTNKFAAASGFAPGAPQSTPLSLAFQTRVTGNSGENIRVRTDFPETWLWEEVTLNGTNSLDLVKTIPDTLTSWFITGYSLNTDTGLGVFQGPKKVTVFRPFFLSLNLPYSVVKGEVLVLQVLVHNYLPTQRNTSAEITLENSKNQFQFNDKSLKDAKESKKTVSCPPNSVTSVTFVIVPSEFGSVMLNVKGLTATAGDALSQPLRVKPPGQQQRRTASALLRTARSSVGNDTSITNGTTTEAAELTANLTTIFPVDRVQGADTVKISFISDILGSTIANLDKMLQIPTGCGEQNMLNFVADIVILDYLKATFNLDEKVKAKAIGYLETGYQRELTYRHPDGSFSAFGTSDSQGSTWLTAFVVRSFIQAKPYITIDDNVISSALDFLAKKQFDNGGLFENGRVLHSGLQGGSSSSGVALTAYTVLAFIEAAQNFNQSLSPSEAEAETTVAPTQNEDFESPNSEKTKKPNYAQNVQKGLGYITNQTKAVNKEDPYALVLTAYALELANHPQKNEYFDKLQEVATRDGGLTFWETKKQNKTKSLNETEHYYPWELVTQPVSVEMTGYALLTYILQGKIGESFPLVKWLLKERNANGGFHSTQDTVLGLTALAKYAQLTRDNVTDLQVNATYGSEDKLVTINKSNAEVLQEFELPNDTSSVQVALSGKGTVLCQLTWRYYVEDAVREPAFAVNVNTSTKSTGELLLNICTSYLKGAESNMAIIEVNLPSGYSVDKDFLGELKNVPGFKRYDIDNGDTKLDVYLDSITSNKTCLPVTALRAFKVGKQAPAFVHVYDYYDTTQSARAFYEAPAVSICDICQENNDCAGNNCV